MVSLALFRETDKITLMTSRSEMPPTLLWILLVVPFGALAFGPYPPGVRRLGAQRAAAPPAADDVAVILLAGGVGSRMKADRPKQFLDLQGKPVLMHSLELFLSLTGIAQVVLVLDASYRDEFKAYDDGRLSFADPGDERQDSVRNGFKACDDKAALICIHDAARPLVTPEAIYQVLADARQHGAAVLGVPVKPTIKETEDGEFVLKTLERKRLWEVQTPQVIQPGILAEGFAQVDKKGLEVTDDVSIVEQIGKKVKLTLGDYSNLKLTTPDDMVYAAAILDKRRAGEHA